MPWCSYRVTSHRSGSQYSLGRYREYVQSDRATQPYRSSLNPKKGSPSSSTPADSKSYRRQQKGGPNRQDKTGKPQQQGPILTHCFVCGFALISHDTTAPNASAKPYRQQPLNALQLPLHTAKQDRVQPGRVVSYPVIARPAPVRPGPSLSWDCPLIYRFFP